MNFIDIRSVFLINTLNYIICTFVVFLMWKNNRSRFRGIGFWFADFLVISAGNILVLLRGTIPDFISIIIANILFMSGIAFLQFGLEQFLSLRRIWKQNLLILAIFASIHVWFTCAHPNLAMRNINISVTLALLCFQCMWLLLFRVSRSLRRFTLTAGLVFGAYSLVNIVRAVELFFRPNQSNDFFKSAGADIVFLIIYQLLIVLLAYSLSLLINGFLRKDLILNEEKLSKAFHSSPNGIILSRLNDGTIFEVNNAFVLITGYSVQEAAGKTAVELNLWVNPGERDAVVDELNRSGHIHEKELCFRKKNGEIITALFSADFIVIDGTTMLLSTLSDITERKRSQDKIIKLLEEKELILKEIHHRVKNNMHIVSALLTLQAEDQNNQEVSAALSAAAGRVQSMAVLYDKLYRTERFESVPLRDYLLPLTKQIVEIFPSKNEVRLAVDIDNAVIDTNRLSSIGIIINELIVNALKYAFASEPAPVLTIQSKSSGSRITISVQDNGSGLPDNMTAETSSGFGMKLVTMLVAQIRGTIRCESGKDSGTKYTIEFDI